MRPPSAISSQGHRDSEPHFLECLPLPPPPSPSSTAQFHQIITIWNGTNPPSNSTFDALLIASPRHRKQGNTLTTKYVVGNAETLSKDSNTMSSTNDVGVSETMASPSLVQNYMQRNPSPPRAADVLSKQDIEV
jgi:hypothetical protein